MEIHHILTMGYLESEWIYIDMSYGADEIFSIAMTLILKFN